MNFVEELRWRGMIHDIMPGTEEELLKGSTSGYIGFDPTSDSLHIGSLVPIMILVHFQRAGHKPVALVGGATGMVGDPSGKSEERKLLDEDQINTNLEGIKNQLAKFLDFETKENPAAIVNNYDWFKGYDFLGFIRDVGKHISVNYMMAKESVKKRLESGMSFTEFSYQLVQGYDFLHLYRTHNCIVQMGGSDQWGNITTGTELIRRMDGGKAFAITTPLLKKADGSKFGKSEGGNVWLDPEKTSPFQFYQHWLKTSDEDAKTQIKIFTLLDESTINDLIKEHDEAPERRVLQKELAKQVTCIVHGEEAWQKAVDASMILFGKSTEAAIRNLSEQDLLQVFDGVPMVELSKDQISAGYPIVDFLADKEVYTSKGDARRNLKGNAVSINSNKVTEEKVLEASDLINDKYIVVQKGKKNYYLVIAN